MYVHERSVFSNALLTIIQVSEKLLLLLIEMTEVGSRRIGHLDDILDMYICVRISIYVHCMSGVSLGILVCLLI